MFVFYLFPVLFVSSFVMSFFVTYLFVAVAATLCVFNMLSVCVLKVLHASRTACPCSCKFGLFVCVDWALCGPSG